MSVYVVDTNFFIQAHRATYPLDVASGFWNKVKQLASEGKIISIDKVKHEIYQNDDALKDWCLTNLPQDFFKPTDGIMNAYAKVAIWTSSKSNFYKESAIEEFLAADEADAFLIAFALNDLTQYIIVTQEISQSGRRNKIKIPDPCIEIGISFVNVIDMFRQLGETF